MPRSMSTDHFRKIVDYFIVRKSPAGRVDKVEVTEEYGLPPKPVRWEVALAKMEEWRKKKQNVPRKGPGADEPMKTIAKKKNRQRVVSTFLRS